MTRTFLSVDAATAVTIADRAFDAIVQRCRDAGGVETGGVLIGRYTEWLDRAIVVEAAGPPRDSRQGPRAFWRGVAGLGRLLRERWRTSHTYYLGEWHFHPFMSAQPSSTDLDQIRAFAADPAYQCPRPVLVVVGGDPATAPEVEVVVVEGGAVVRRAPAGP